MPKLRPKSAIRRLVRFFYYHISGRYRGEHAPACFRQGKWWLRRTLQMGDRINSVPPTSSNTAICTLFEGDYHFGLAAFVNSLVASGYSGTVWAGYRGPLPPWINRLKQLSTQAGEYAVNEQVRLTFVPLVSGIHFTHYKPEFMLNLLANQARDCE